MIRSLPWRSTVKGIHVPELSADGRPVMPAEGDQREHIRPVVEAEPSEPEKDPMAAWARGD